MNAQRLVIVTVVIGHACCPLATQDTALSSAPHAVLQTNYFLVITNF